MCVFVSEEEPVDVLWIGKVVLITPDGLDSEHEVQVIINGLIRPKKDCEEITLNFAHRGEIYGLKDISKEWLNVKKDKNEDWLSARILNHPELGLVPRFEYYEEDKLNIHSKRGSVIAEVLNSDKISISDIDVYCREEDKKHAISEMSPKACFDKLTPIYSSFKLSLKDPEPNFQLFRITFRTKASVRSYHSQINVEIQGPDTMLHSLRRDISRKTTEPVRRNKLLQQILNLPEFGREPDLDIVVVGYPQTSLMIECAENTGSKHPIEFSLESKGTSIKSAACKGRVAFFGSNRNDAVIKVIATPTIEYHRQHSPEFLEMLEHLKLEEV